MLRSWTKIELQRFGDPQEFMTRGISKRGPDRESMIEAIIDCNMVKYGSEEERTQLLERCRKPFLWELIPSKIRKTQFSQADANIIGRTSKAKMISTIISSDADIKLYRRNPGKERGCSGV